MPVRQRPCGRCGGSVIHVHAAHGAIPLEPWPLLPSDPHTDRTVRVDVVRHGLVLLAAGDASSARTKRYERHRCVTRSTAVPAPWRRAEQLGLDL